MNQLTLIILVKKLFTYYHG